ncbi:MAG TPA: GNAT family N-acetyltransferase [Acidobacteriaceae bacterium]
MSRLTDYFRRNGFLKTVQRAALSATRSVSAGRMVVLYCDLDERTLRPVNVPGNFAIRRVTALSELSLARLQEMTSFWNPTLAGRYIRERFAKGASLWMVESGDDLAGFGWTIQGDVIAPYYFPMGAKDVQLFDFYVFPRFRGRAIHWLLTGHILHTLAAEGGSRAFADTGEWNQAQLASFRMTPFRILGVVRTYRLLGRLLVRWDASRSVDCKLDGAAPTRNAVRALRPNG